MPAHKLGGASELARVCLFFFFKISKSHFYKFKIGCGSVAQESAFYGNLMEQGGEG